MPTRTATARAHANLAFVKYWGKADAALNLPLNSSISMNLSGAVTTTTVTLDGSLAEDLVLVANKPAPPAFAQRVSRQLDRVRALAGARERARVTTANSFPAGAGIASSASGMAALTVAAAAALELNLGERALSVLARRGSGSACRSVPGGFVEWHAAATSDESFAEQIAPPEHWPLIDLAVVVSREAKKVPSSEGHELALGSELARARLDALPERARRIRRAIIERDFETFGRETEAEAMAMHAVAMTSAHEAGGAWRSGVYYWAPETLELLIAAQEWRADGLPVYFTLDAGPTVHLLCEARHADAVTRAVRDVERRAAGRAWEIMRNEPAPGAQLVTSDDG